MTVRLSLPDDRYLMIDWGRCSCGGPGFKVFVHRGPKP